MQGVNFQENPSNETRHKVDELLFSPSTVSSVINGSQTYTVCSACAEFARCGVRGKSIQSKRRYSRKVLCGSIATMLKLLVAYMMKVQRVEFKENPSNGS